MSDVSQGPGWWQASDGKWYPPEQHPDFGAPTQPVPTAPPTQPLPAAPPVGPPSGPPGMPPPGATQPFPVASAGGGGSRTPLFVALGASAVVVLGVVAFVAFRGNGGGSTASFCTDAKKIASDAALQDPSSDPAKFDAAVGVFDRLTKESPSEIKNDMKTIDDFVHKLADAVKKSSSNSDSFGDVLSVFATADQHKLEAAGNNVNHFVEQKCGVDLKLDSTSSDLSFSSDLGSAFSDFSQFSNFASDFSQFSNFSSDFSDLSSLSDFATEFSSLFQSDFSSTNS